MLVDARSAKAVHAIFQAYHGGRREDVGTNWALYIITFLLVVLVVKVADIIFDFFSLALFPFRYLHDLLDVLAIFLVAFSPSLLPVRRLALPAAIVVAWRLS